MMFKLQFFGGRGAGGGTDIPFATPAPASGGGSTGMDENPGSPDTLAEALGTKGAPMSMKDAVKDANPFYDGSYGEYSENCQRAVVATEARLRGYDVIAQPTYDNDTLPSGENWMSSFKNAKSVSVGRSTAAATQREVENTMKNYGNGARAVLEVGWKGRNGTGHVLNVVNRNGRIYYIDGQVNRQYRGSDLFRVVKTDRTRLVRVDNLDFGDTAREAVRQNPFR